MGHARSQRVFIGRCMNIFYVLINIRISFLHYYGMMWILDPLVLVDFVIVFVYDMDVFN